MIGSRRGLVPKSRVLQKPSPPAIPKTWIAEGGDQFQASRSITTGQTLSLIFHPDDTTTGIQAPRNQFMRVTAMATYTQLPAAWGNLKWNWYINGVVHETYRNQADQIGLEHAPMPLGKPIEVPPGGFLDVKLSNSAGIDYAGGVLMIVEYGRKE